TWIFVRLAIETAREAPIRNRHFDPPTISPIPRFSSSSASLDYANRWQRQHTESAYHGDQKSCSTQLEISTPAKELGITFRQDIGITYVTIIQNRHSETVDKALVSGNSVMGPKFHRGACGLVHRLSYTLGSMRIFVRPAIEIAREAPIRNRHIDPVGTRSHSEISGPTPKFLFGSMVAGYRCDCIRTPLRSNRHNFPLGYQNRLYCPNSESTLRGARHPLIALGDKMSFRGRKTFVSHSEVAIPADDLPDSKVFWQ
ncbi:hypothetical protein Taro_045445, partial [Colocasia esculenta]|nr:hypothetical protein [Colocasia esculenta]